MLLILETDKFNLLFRMSPDCPSWNACRCSPWQYALYVFNSFNTLVLCSIYYDPHFTDKETEAH